MPDVTGASELERGATLAPQWGPDGLLPAIAQDADTGRVLMLAWVNAEALALSLRTGEAHYWSRSRQALWRKGETSGNVQRLVEVLIDCDQDALLLRVEQTGPACHTGEKSCFYRRVEDGGGLAFVAD